MPNLLDTIRNNNAETTQPQGMTDQASKLSTLLRAKSGKAVGGSAPAASNLGEQQAVAQTNQTLQNVVAPQAEIQAQGVQQQQAGIQQQEAQQQQQISQARKFDNVQNNLRVNEILSDLSRNKGSIDQQKDAARLEQLGATLRLQNTQYVDNLQREGQKARLDDLGRFKEEYLRSSFDNNADLMENSRLADAALRGDKRSFDKEVAQMDVDTAWSIFNANQRAQQDAARWGAIGAGTTGGVAAYGASQNGKPAAASNNPGVNETSFSNSMSSTPFAPSSSNTGNTGDFNSGSSRSMTS